ncbi:hypothetical protein XENORESO_004371 [Xenotaenia resolanae]|uniref:Uncharacterized protein n=1 Tax=Xenotaenia resolanae TaxID=208358 RepID=A0ABV0WV11_9TELE
MSTNNFNSLTCTSDGFTHNPECLYSILAYFMSYILLVFVFPIALIFDGSVNPAHPKHIGSIDPSCDVVEVVKDAYETSKMLCEQYYLTSPDMEIKEVNCKSKATHAFNFQCAVLL